jgi:hypothetical protein
MRDEISSIEYKYHDSLCGLKVVFTNGPYYDKSIYTMHATYDESGHRYCYTFKQKYNLKYRSFCNTRKLSWITNNIKNSLYDLSQFGIDPKFTLNDYINEYMERRSLCLSQR